MFATVNYRDEKLFAALARAAERLLNRDAGRETASLLRTSTFCVVVFVLIYSVSKSVLVLCFPKAGCPGFYVFLSWVALGMSFVVFSEPPIAGVGTDRTGAKISRGLNRKQTCKTKKL